MIDFLRGKAVHIDTDFVVLDVNGVGYRVFCAHPQQFANKNDEIVIYTHYHVREDALNLYGFSSRDEQKLFRLLLEVSGIGPKVAIGMMSGARPEALIAAIRSENVSFLTRLPGVGKKTAQRIILDLKDKLKDFDDAVREYDRYEDTEMNSQAASMLTESWLEAKEGLKALGFTEAEADQALASVKKETDRDLTVDMIIKQALKSLSRRG
mgnify:CR=1 FL=1|jgi:Holliday junction DNA helicase RuvA